MPPNNPLAIADSPADIPINIINQSSRAASLTLDATERIRSKRRCLVHHQKDIHTRYTDVPHRHRIGPIAQGHVPVVADRRVGADAGDEDERRDVPAVHERRALRRVELELVGAWRAAERA